MSRVQTCSAAAERPGLGPSEASSALEPVWTLKAWSFHGYSITVWLQVVPSISSQLTGTSAIGIFSCWAMYNNSTSNALRGGGKLLAIDRTHTHTNTHWLVQ